MGCGVYKLGFRGTNSTLLGEEVRLERLIHSGSQLRLSRQG
jgi:hypothetical protein